MSANQGEVFTGGATTSQHVDAEDDDHFQNTTFKLKRTRLLGLLDEFIDPEEQQRQIEEHNAHADAQPAADGPDADEPRASSPAQDATHTPSPPFLKSPDIVPQDDSDLVVEPWRHVDYLSHKWDVSDISKSWRYVISRRKNVANAARLENASWRTWAQRRSNLKTISPEEVNWSKDSDVTWLYGPIVDDDDHDNDLGAESALTFNTASSVVAGDISIARKTHRPKPILKKRTVQDMMISHLNLLKLQVATARAEQEQRRREDAAAQARQDATGGERPPEYFDYDVISAKLNSQYRNYSQPTSISNSTNNSMLDLAARNNPQLNTSALKSELENIASKQGSARNSPAIVQDEKEDTRHIHFNDEVQQCIAINEYEEDYDYDDEVDDDDETEYEYGHDESYLYEPYSDRGDSEELGSGADDDDDDDDDDEGGFFLKVRSPSSASMAGVPLPGLSSANKEASKEIENTEDTESISTNNSKVYKTIHLLPPTTLNYGSSDEESDDSNPYTSSMSHNVNQSTSRGYDYHYDYNTVYQVDPNHAIYGVNVKTKAPDVVDVPENIGIGSNFDYEFIENEDVKNYNQPMPPVLGHSGPLSTETSQGKDKLPINSLDDSALTVRPNPFSLDASDSDSDSEEEVGLSISAKNSSQSLAQLVFGQPLTAAAPVEQHYPAEPAEAEPEARHISSINPRYSSTALSKQPHSSNSLSEQFLGGGMAMSQDNSSLTDLFFNAKPGSPAPAQQASPSSYLGTQSPPVQSKTSPLPPTTTSTNAFLGTKTPPLQRAASKKSFIFESECESEDEYVEDVSGPLSSSDRTPNSYASLYQVAGRNGIAVPAADSEEAPKKGLAVSNFLGSWNKGSSS